MGGAFVITLREAFEAALLLGIVTTYLVRTGAAAQVRLVVWGGALGLAASVAMALSLTWLSGPLADIGPDVIAVTVMFVAVALLTWHGWWMREHARALRGDLQRRIDEARSTQRFWIVGMIAFTGVFREGAETVLFLWGLVSQREASAWAQLGGALLGVAGAALLGWMIFAGGRAISLPRFFTTTSLLLLLLAAGLFSAGVGRLEGLGMLPRSPELWDTSWLLADRGAVGGFLAGLLGYRARPSALEVAAYAAYLIIAGRLLFGPGGRARGMPSPAADEGEPVHAPSARVG
jgi:high-affinity iron transporter